MLRKWLAAGIAVCLVIFGTLPAAALAQPQAAVLPFELPVKSAVLIDAESGTVLAQKNADEKLPMASVTKIMTLLLVFEAMDQGQYGLEDEVPVSPYAAGMGGSQALLDAGGVYPVTELVKSIIVASANDSSVAMAEFTSGSAEAFVARMNQRALELGMRNTHFVNCNGLPAADHYSSAADIAVMCRELLKHGLFYQYSTIWTDQIVHNDGRVTMLANTNKLLRSYAGCDGVKTGSTGEAGYCMAVTALREDSRFIAMVLGAKTSQERFSAASKLLDHAFANYTHTVVYDKDQVVSDPIPVRGGKTEAIRALAAEKVCVLTPRTSQADIQLEVELPEYLEAPVEAHSYIGTVSVRENGELVGTYPLCADQGVEKAGFWDRVVKLVGRF
ncbi:MAG: D-alanyl-D-alanine carboxypeptidase [Eubacteriales bacterium]|nr:D-alanyl-D-alanine carboxypeptidase [Eubacteriales bacterium]